MNRQDVLLELGRRITSERIRQDMTQAELAKRVRTGRSYISLLEQGQQNLTFYRFLQLARALSLNPCDLLSADFEHETKP